VGIDTVKFSYDVRSLVPMRYGTSDWWQRRGFSAGKYGSVGPCMWQEFKSSCGVRVVLKGVPGRSVNLLWEGSVPKALGIVGACPPDDVRVWDRYLRSLVPKMGMPRVRRVDLTHDVVDPLGLWRSAALRWNPHARSRYVQAVYDNPANGGQTVFQYNKSRGVRVYDKFAECGESWAVGLTRVEYQMHKEWCVREGLDVLDAGWGDRCDLVAGQVVADLRERLEGGIGGWQE